MANVLMMKKKSANLIATGAEMVFAKLMKAVLIVLLIAVIAILLHIVVMISAVLMNANLHAGKTAVFQNVKMEFAKLKKKRIALILLMIVHVKMDIVILKQNNASIKPAETNFAT